MLQQRRSPTMQTDLWTNLSAAPAFLAQTGTRDREPWRVLAFVALWLVGGLIIGALIFFTVMSFSDELSQQFPAAVRGLRAAPLGRVPAAQVGPDIGLIGGLFLCWLGVQTFRARPAEEPAQAEARGRLSAYATTFLLTLTNPLTILSFASEFAEPIGEWFKWYCRRYGNQYSNSQSW